MRRRLERPPPPRDDKVLTDWNGLMIRAPGVPRDPRSPEALRINRKCLGFHKK